MTDFIKRQVAEWQFTTSRTYENPFADVAVDAHITAPSGAARTMPLFYDGDGVFKLRFNPGEPGAYKVQLSSRPADPDFAKSFSFTVADSDARGFLVATPGDAWGFRFENGEPVFISATPHTISSPWTIAAATRPPSCGGGKHRASTCSGTRLTTSRFHLPDGHFEWQNKSCWPWGGSTTLPRFDLFNLDYFRSVDQTIRVGEELGIGFEMIMEGWGNEFPFNSRQWFTPEWEALWMRYLIARYDAYNCVWMWTPLNEYEYYPNGDWHWTASADRWALRIGRWIKETGAHDHVLAMHNGPRLPPFAQRFKADPEAVDVVMFQEWGTRDKELGWLAAGIEESIGLAFEGWTRSVVFAEWGYERNPEYKLKLPSHEFCDRSHTRRSAWRGVFCGMGIVAGFENSWGPWMDLENDLPGVADLEVLNRFVTGAIGFDTLRPAPALIAGSFEEGHRPLALQATDGSRALVYFPVGGSAEIGFAGSASCFDPRTGTTTAASADAGRYTAPVEQDADGHPHDFILVLTA